MQDSNWGEITFHDSLAEHFSSQMKESHGFSIHSLFVTIWLMDDAASVTNYLKHASGSGSKK